jgi:hypothetical protein
MVVNAFSAKEERKNQKENLYKSKAPFYLKAN